MVGATVSRAGLLLGILGSAACATQRASSTPIADGVFAEWQGVPPIAVDALGDSAGAGDLEAVYASTRGTRLFLHFDINAELNLQSGASPDDVPRAVITLEDGSVLELDFRDRTYRLDGNPVGWDALGYEAAPTFASERHEVTLDLAAVGAEPGDTVTIDFAGPDTLDEPVGLTLTGSEAPPTRRSAEREEGTSFRIASLNTLRTGLLDGGQRPALLRMLDAVDAEIYALQEEYNSTAAEVAMALEAADPLEDGASWNVVKNNDNVVASRSALIELPAYDRSYAAAIVTDAGGRAVCVLSIHPKCCGYAGSSEDARRIQQSEAMARTIDELRAGELGDDLLPYRFAPVIVIGDWNLVGSREPLRLLESNAEGRPGLRGWLLRNLIGGSTATWIGSSTGAGSFAPGRLDLVAYDPDRLAPRNGFVLDTRRLNASELDALGVEAGDSGASDHLLLVADFTYVEDLARACEGDVNGDGRVDVGDVREIIPVLGAGGGFADADGSGGVDVVDIRFVVQRLGLVCE